MTDQKTLNDIIEHLDRSGKREWADCVRGMMVRTCVKGNLTVMGKIDTLEPDGEIQHHDLALLIDFENSTDIRQAISDGYCEFKF